MYPLRCSVYSSTRRFLGEPDNSKLQVRQLRDLRNKNAYEMKSSRISIFSGSSIMPSSGGSVDEELNKIDMSRIVEEKGDETEFCLAEVACERTKVERMSEPSIQGDVRQMDGKLTSTGRRRRIALGGHRGMGANCWNECGPYGLNHRYRENTVSSCIAAAQAGASFVEFDVQVTSDNIPVIFHDNYLVFGSLENPESHHVKDIPLMDFKWAAPINSSMSDASLAGMSDEEVNSTLEWDSIRGESPRSTIGNGRYPSVEGGSPIRGTGDQAERYLMRSHKNHAVVLNGERSLSRWQVEEEDEFPTLLEMFEKIPKHVAFDIEVKMTTPSDVPQTPKHEIDRVLAAILPAISFVEERMEAQGAPHRNLVFSSFDPEICSEIKRRRPNDAVMFLSGGGRYHHVDPRRTSIDAAISFAREHNLQGIILDSEALFMDQGAVLRATEHDLFVMTYGDFNNDPFWVLRQEELNVHGVIVDDVARVAKFLR